MQMGSSDVSALQPTNPASRAIKWDIASQWDKDSDRRVSVLPSLPSFETKIVLVAGAAREGFRLRVSFKPRSNYRKQRRE